MQFGRMGAGFGRMGVQGASFNLDAYLAAIGASYYDFTKTDDQFQEATGPTPANVIGNPIGLKLDRGLWRGKTLTEVVAGQPELAPGGGTFDSSTGWAISYGNEGTQIAGGVGTIKTALTYSAINFPSAVAGKLYRVAWSIVANRGGSMKVDGYGNTTTYSGVGSYVTYGEATGTVIGFARSGIPTDIDIDNVSIKLIPGIPAIQSNNALKPTYQSTGSKYDGNDDNLLTSYLAGSGANFIVALVTVPASLAASQLFVGASAAGPSARFYMQFTTGGLVAAGVGNLASGDGLVGTTDWRGQEVVVGLSCDGSSIRLFDGLSQVTIAQSGNPTTAVPIRLGSQNSNGTAANPFGGSIKRLVAGREFLTLSRYQQIRNALLAA